MKESNFITADQLITTKEYRRIQVFADLVNDFNKKIQDLRVVMYEDKTEINKLKFFNMMYQFKESVKDFGLSINLNDYLEI